MTTPTSTLTPSSTDRSWVRSIPLNKPAVVRLAGGGVALFAVWTVLGLVYMGLFDDGSAGDADRRASRWIEDRRTDGWNTWSNYGSMLSDTLTKVVLIAIVGGVMVLVWRRWHDGLFLAVAVIIESSAFALSSLVVDRDRPPIDQLDPVPVSGSFPSGHTAAAVAFYLGLYVIARWHTTSPTLRAALLTFGLVVPVIVAASRYYRGMHHISDVAAGYALGVATLVVVAWALDAGVHELDRRAQHGRRSPSQTRSLTMADRDDDDAAIHHHEGVLP